VKYDLEERLIKFASCVIDLVDELPANKACSHLSSQLIRCGTAPALVYGEAQAAESPKDFVHKMSICLKELRETLIILKIIHGKAYIPRHLTDKLMTEADELISIFVTSIKTAKTNQSKKQRPGT
jgi:four helix bundle protein